MLIARALCCEPDLLLLDEPSLGLAPKIVQKIFEIIQKKSALANEVDESTVKLELKKKPKKEAKLHPGKGFSMKDIVS